MHLSTNDMSALAPHTPFGIVRAVVDDVVRCRGSALAKNDERAKRAPTPP